MATNNSHRWKFFRAGGFDQVRLDSGADIANLDQLDQKLWVALACPTTGLEFDPKTLALLDTDNDGRIRAPELIEAAKWVTSLLKNPDDLLKSSPSLPLNAINDATPEGKRLLASARQILINLGKPDVANITLEDTADTAKIFAQTHFNGDGIVPADAATDEPAKAVINEIIACLGAETDRSGRPGINQAKVDQFFAEAQAFSSWWKTAEGNPGILPLGESTIAAAAAVRAVKAKVDDYFARCRLAAFDARALNALNREEKEYLALVAKDLTITAAEVAGFPLARVEANKPLPLKDGVNPAWAAAIAALNAAAVKPLLGDKASLAEADWTTLLEKFGAYENWSAGKVGALVETLGVKRIRGILGGKTKEIINGLIAKDQALEPEASAIAAVDKLVHCYRDLYLLCINFVSFKDFYDRGEPAIFQAGTLYLDQRSCELCLPVEDATKHSVMAGLAGTFLTYCDCFRKGSNEKRQIVAAFTDGDSDNLIVGRNGIFYDRKRRDWDATITRIVDNPISIRQAFWSPYKKVARLIQEQLAKRAAAADTAATNKLAQAAARAGQATAPGQSPATPALVESPKPKVEPGMIAALSVGAAGVGGMVGGIVSGFLNMKGLMPLGVLAVILLISGPAMVMAWLKLRKRNLGPILDANGWAVNARAKINVPFGKSLTQVAKLPPGAQRDLRDPYAEKTRPWKLYAFIIVVLGLALGWYLGKLDGLLPAKLKSISVMGINAPAYQPPAAKPTGPGTNAPPGI